MNNQSCTQTPQDQDLWPTVGHLERLWEIKNNDDDDKVYWLVSLLMGLAFLTRDFCSEKSFSRVSPGNQVLTKEPQGARLTDKAIASQLYNQANK